jgi:hypothetical protein
MFLITDQSGECVSECWKEKYQLSGSYSDLQLATNFLFGNWSISSNQRWFLNREIIWLGSVIDTFVVCYISSNHLAALNFYYPTFTQTLLVNHYPTINQWLGKFYADKVEVIWLSMPIIENLFLN